MSDYKNRNKINPIVYLLCDIFSVFLFVCVLVVLYLYE